VDGRGGTMSRKHTPGRRTRRKRKDTAAEQVADQARKTYRGQARKLPMPEVIVLAPRIRTEPAQEAPAEEDATASTEPTKDPIELRAEVVADIREEMRRWR